MSKIVYPQLFDIVGVTGIDRVPYVFINGIQKYRRLLVEPVIKMEDRDCEIVDEETDTIYAVPEWMIPIIIEKIEYERMTKDWKKTIQFTGEQEDTLRLIEQLLFFLQPNSTEGEDKPTAIRK